MSRVTFALAVGAMAALVSLSAEAAGTNHMGIPIAPGGGKTSLHQWGGVDDAFAVNPDADDEAALPQKGSKPSAMTQSHDDQDSDDDDGPDTDHVDELLAV
jgi:hypothetical protein